MITPSVLFVYILDVTYLQSLSELTLAISLLRRGQSKLDFLTIPSVASLQHYKAVNSCYTPKSAQ